MFAGGAGALASSLVDNGDCRSTMLYVKGRKARVYRNDILALGLEAPEALHVLADTDTFAPHRSSKTTADRFDVRTLLDEDELERFSSRRTFSNRLPNRQRCEHEDEEEEYDFERYHDMPSGDHTVLEPPWIPLPGDSDEEQGEEEENSRFQQQRLLRRSNRHTQYGHYGPCASASAGEKQWSTVAPPEEFERKGSGIEEDDVKGKVDIQSPLDELDTFEPNEDESKISPQLEVILRLRQESSHAFGFLHIQNSLNSFYTFLKSLPSETLDLRMEELKSLQYQNERERQANSTARGLLGATYFSSDSDSESDNENNPTGTAKSVESVEMIETDASGVEKLLPPREMSFVIAEKAEQNGGGSEVANVGNYLDVLLDNALHKNSAAKKKTMGENGRVGGVANSDQEEEEKLRSQRRKRAKLLSSHFKQQLEGQNVKS